MKRRKFGDVTVSRRLSVLMGVLSLGWLIAGIIGGIQTRWPLAAFGFGLFLFFGLASWWLSPVRIRRS